MAGEDNRVTAPYESLLKAIVEKIQVQPFLFIIAIAALIVALVIVGAELGSPDFRFVVLVIAGLATVAMAGYYLQEVRKSTSGTDQASSLTPRPERPTQTMEAEQGGEITRATQQTEDATDQSMRAVGSGSRLDKVRQLSGAPAESEPPAGGRRGIEPALYGRLRELLMECAPLETDQALRPIFVDDRLSPWRNKLPATRSIQARAEGIIDFLHDKSNTLGENALVLFLHVAAERLGPADACRERLLAMAQELQSHS